MKFSQDEEYWDTAEVAKAIKKTPAAVRNLVLRRKIPFRKPAGRLLFIKSEIRKWVADAPGVRLEDIS